nr:AAA family ATPase [Bradyrhizobium sp. 2S1]MCK7664886.1 AAA family ATPase [Bradyrhizobium sp. 2S1]
MADALYFIQTLGLTGFRAFLQPKTFDFSKKRCLAIFAPNGNGKSSVIDALEFMFSKDGTLDRLGLRTINNNAGFVALAHNLAEEAKLAPSVTIGFATGGTVTSGSRSAAGAKRPMPAIVVTVSGCLAVSPIIRGHVLRTFVEAHTPEQRYTDVATWLQLGPLVEVQKNIRALRSQIKAAADDRTAQQRVDGQLAKETANAVTAWDGPEVLVHANTVLLAPLDKVLVLKALDVSDPAYVELTNRAKAEEHQVGLAGLRQIRQAAATLWNEVLDEESGKTVVAGAVPMFETGAADLSKAVKAEVDERGKAASSAFQTLWKAAEPFFTEGGPSPEACPICMTPITETKAGSADGIRAHVAKHLEELADYAAAKSALNSANLAANKAHTLLVAALPGIAGLLGDAEGELKAKLASYRAAVEVWSSGDPPASAAVVAAISALLGKLGTKIADIEAKQGDQTYAKAKVKIDRLLELQAERLLAIRTQEELRSLSEALTAQATTISGEIRKKVQALLDKLQTPMNNIYKVIQGAGAAPIRLELPAEDDTNQQRLNLVIDFAKNRPGVQPGGYLSDSQIHSVALALRLAAIKQFNPSAPIIALDDIVTSYDADHRRTIGSLVAAMFSDCQILVTTHDERFFNYLKDQLEAKDWHFTRIIGLDPAYGPRFADHKVSDEMIETRWAEGQFAANEMRQAEEEWLLGICRDFGVSVRIRRLERAYSYERSELASALASFLRDAKLDPKPIAGINNRFLTSLQKGEIENFGSHFQDGPYGDGSIGDERARWDEFKAFRKQFACPKCERTRFQRPFTLKKPVCAHAGCEAQFEFLAVAPSAPVAKGTV